MLEDLMAKLLWDWSGYDLFLSHHVEGLIEDLR